MFHPDNSATSISVSPGSEHRVENYTPLIHKDIDIKEIRKHLRGKKTKTYNTFEPIIFEKIIKAREDENCNEIYKLLINTNIFNLTPTIPGYNSIFEIFGLNLNTTVGYWIKFGYKMKNNSDLDKDIDFVLSCIKNAEKNEIGLFKRIVRKIQIDKQATENAISNLEGLKKDLEKYKNFENNSDYTTKDYLLHVLKYNVSPTSRKTKKTSSSKENEIKPAELVEVINQSPPAAAKKGIVRRICNATSCFFVKTRQNKTQKKLPKINNIPLESFDNVRG